MSIQPLLLNNHSFIVHHMLLPPPPSAVAALGGPERFPPRSLPESVRLHPSGDWFIKKRSTFVNNSSTTSPSSHWYHQSHQSSLRSNPSTMKSPSQSKLLSTTMRYPFKSAISTSSLLINLRNITRKLPVVDYIANNVMNNDQIKSDSIKHSDYCCGNSSSSATIFTSSTVSFIDGSLSYSSWNNYSGELVNNIQLDMNTVRSGEYHSNNDSSGHQQQQYNNQLRHSLPWTIILIIAYLIVFLFGLFGNISVLWIVYMLKRETKYRHQSGMQIQAAVSSQNTNNFNNNNHHNQYHNGSGNSASGFSVGSTTGNCLIMSNGHPNYNFSLHHHLNTNNNQNNDHQLTRTLSNTMTTMANMANTTTTTTTNTTPKHHSNITNMSPHSSGQSTQLSQQQQQHQTVYYQSSSVPLITINRSNQVFYRFVCNLALADLLVVLFCLIPTLIGNIYLPWVLGRSVCKAVPYLQGVSVNASVYTLVAISIDRFYAIYYPLNKKCSTVMCWTTIILIWLFSMIISFPWLVYFDVITVQMGMDGLDESSSPATATMVMMQMADNNPNLLQSIQSATTTTTTTTTMATSFNQDQGSGSSTSVNNHQISNLVETTIQICGDTWPSAEMANAHFLIVNLGLQYLIPLSIIALFYILILKKIAERKLPKLARHLPANVKDGNRQSSLVIERSKVKVFKMLIVLVLLFALSWLPLYVIFFILKIGPRIDEQSLTMQILQDSVPIAQWLGASNSCVNPILYFFFNAKFRSYYRSTWLKTFSCLSAIRYRHHHGGSNLNRHNSHYQNNNNNNLNNSSHSSHSSITGHSLNYRPSPKQQQLQQCYGNGNTNGNNHIISSTNPQQILLLQHQLQKPQEYFNNSNRRTHTSRTSSNSSSSSSSSPKINKSTENNNETIQVPSMATTSQMIINCAKSTVTAV